jgi:hypothetical protein
MEDTEVWLPIANYDNYEVSSFGKVRNKKTGRILKASSKGGYYSVGLSNINTKTHSVHQIVAKTFIPNPKNKPHVNHKDKNGLNNNFTNLEWCTAKENNIHKSKGVVQTTNQNINVWRIDLITDLKLEKYNSIYEASKWLIENKYGNNLNTISGGISCASRGIYRSSFGFKWVIEKGDNLDNEIWKEIIIENKDTKGYYISSLGRFKNRKGVIMKDYKPHHTGYIYLRVNIDKYALHRLIAQMFIENPENKPFVNHIDGNKLNNTVNNLEWVTCAENNLHNHKTGLIKCYTRKIIQYDLEMNELNKFNSIVEASQTLKIGLSGIKAVLYNKQKTTAGSFIFKYLE